ncbi:hypothetical protein CPB83DRAFT_894737 [Crepidotus variabilis]|uniref:C2H2-type domain-containing protein n=1 Tax=Crepidotus variabilis TaxID=179855 RepID=A0A9P6JPT3_9AGAR|nr:hypothetical protein CPB83DRAFT_894737 [Crepidotus variabilis]
MNFIAATPYPSSTSSATQVDLFQKFYGLFEGEEMSSWTPAPWMEPERRRSEECYLDERRTQEDFGNFFTEERQDAAANEWHPVQLQGHQYSGINHITSWNCKGFLAHRTTSINEVTASRMGTSHGDVGAEVWSLGSQLQSFSYDQPLSAFVNTHAMPSGISYPRPSRPLPQWAHPVAGPSTSTLPSSTCPLYSPTPLRSMQHQNLLLARPLLTSESFPFVSSSQSSSDHSLSLNLPESASFDLTWAETLSCDFNALINESSGGVQPNHSHDIPMQCGPNMVMELEPSSGPERSKQTKRKQESRPAKLRVHRKRNQGTNIANSANFQDDHLNLAQFDMPCRLICRLEMISGPSEKSCPSATQASGHLSCKQEFTDLKTMAEHVIKDHRIPQGHGDSKPYKCAWEGCEKEGRVRTHLRHVLGCHILEWKCPYRECGHCFSRHDTLEKHLRETHSRDREDLLDRFDRYHFTIPKQEAQRRVSDR